jgi:plastocyanin
VSNRSTRRSFAALLLLAGVLAGACGGGDDHDHAEDHPGSSGAATPGAPAAATVQLEAVQFEPAKLRVKVGETVQWVWGGGVQHDVAGGSFKSPVKSKGTFSHTFTEAGTFPYKCDVHPTMKGTVTVEP